MPFTPCAYLTATGPLSDMEAAGVEPAQRYGEQFAFLLRPAKIRLPTLPCLPVSPGKRVWLSVHDRKSPNTEINFHKLGSLMPSVSNRSTIFHRSRTGSLGSVVVGIEPTASDRQSGAITTLLYSHVPAFISQRRGPLSRQEVGD